MPTITVFLVIIAVLCLLPTQVAAFGAGNIPSIAYLEDKAFRHGDIEDIIATIILSKTFILSKKFSSLDVKRIYFGNWLRDYSQAIDVATLSRGLPLENLVLLVSVLGFMAHGYATEEFEVTKERLGCYRAEEHIDNPKGYCENDDARRYDQRLRPPVNPMECAIDPQTGMKNYIKNEAGGWPTSSAYVRDQLTKCVSFGKAGDMNEAFRHLGAALHTLEDFSAHSNYCELALLELGYTHVFPFVGDATMVNVMGKRVYPLVTGTFGSTDFVHSLLGEATDHASSISITSLSNQMETARSRSTSGDADINTLVNLLSQAPGMGDLAKEIQSVDQRTRSGPANDQDLKGQIWSLLCLRDKIVKSISQTMEKIPGLNWLAEKITESVQVFILTKLEPLLRPLLSSTTSSLQSLSSTIIASESQQQIFTDPHCSDPTHSQLSKDHFDLFLNEPAGKIAKVVVRHIVEAVVDAWKSGETRQVLGLAMEVMHHPCHVSTALQREMMEVMRVWARENDAKVRMLGKDAVKEHRNR
ncbi:heterokaryon incompatibility Het-C, partial [Gaertneriomyces semiglobifer]